MKKTLFILFGVAFSAISYSQVGINTDSPKTTLQVNGKPTDPSVADGVILPRLSGNELKAKDVIYGTDQTGAIVYVTSSVGTPSTKTINVTSPGFYYFDGSVWQVIGSGGGSGLDTSIYANNGTLSANRTVTMSDKTLAFPSTATTGTSHFTVDGTTLNVDAVNNRVGIGNAVPQSTFHVDGAKDNNATGVPTSSQQANDFIVSTAGNVGIGTTSPDSSAALEIKRTNKGFLPPRVTLTSRTDGTTITSPSTALLVYHIGSSTMESGIYYNAGTATSPNWHRAQIESDTEGGKFYKMIYRGPTVNTSKILNAGLFQFRLVTGVVTGWQLQILEARLISQPATSVTLQGPRIGWQPPPAPSTQIAAGATWTTTDYNTWKTVDYQASGASHLIYLDCSVTEDFYRISFYTRLNDYTSFLVEVF